MALGGSRRAGVFSARVTWGVRPVGGHLGGGLGIPRRHSCRVAWSDVLDIGVEASASVRDLGWACAAWFSGRRAVHGGLRCRSAGHLLATASPGWGGGAAWGHLGRCMNRSRPLPAWNLPALTWPCLDMPGHA